MLVDHFRECFNVGPQGIEEGFRKAYLEIPYHPKVVFLYLMRDFHSDLHI